MRAGQGSPTRLVGPGDQLEPLRPEASLVPVDRGEQVGRRPHEAAQSIRPRRRPDDHERPADHLVLRDEPEAVAASRWSSGGCRPSRTGCSGRHVEGPNAPHVRTRRYGSDRGRPFTYTCPFCPSIVSPGRPTTRLMKSFSGRSRRRALGQPVPERLERVRFRCTSTRIAGRRTR